MKITDVLIVGERIETISKNITELYRKNYGGKIPFDCHPKIRNEKACLTATERVL